MIRLKETLFKSFLGEDHNISGGPENLKVPSINPNQKKYYEVDRDKEGLYYYNPDNTGKWMKSAKALTLVEVDHVKKFPGGVGEKRVWHKEDGQWMFGLYTLDEWKKFLKDVASSGIEDPIKVTVRKSGEAVLTRGNHRLAAYDFLGIDKIPSIIFWYGNTQGKERDPMREYFYDLKEES